MYDKSGEQEVEPSCPRQTHNFINWKNTFITYLRLLFYKRWFTKCAYQDQNFSIYPDIIKVLPQHMMIYNN